MDSIKLVEEFHKVFGHITGDKPNIPHSNQMDFRDKFIKEELQEIQDAFFNNLSEEQILIHLADGLGDIQYVLDGWFLNAGLHNKKDAILAEIHRSNMTKACKTQDEAILTMDKLSAHNPTITYHIEQVGKYHIVYRSSDRKVMKSINYEPPNLNSIIFT